MSIEDDLTTDVMAVLKNEDSKVAVMVAAKVLVSCLLVAIDRGDGDAASAMLQEALDIADRMKGSRLQ